MDAIASVSASAAGSIPAAPVAASHVAESSSSTLISSTSSTTTIGGAAGMRESLLGALGDPAQSKDAMKMLVAMLILEALLGEDRGKAKGLEGAMALSMLAGAMGAPGAGMSMTSSTTTMVAQQNASSAYGSQSVTPTMNVTG